MKNAAPPLKVVSAEGARIKLEDGTELIDGISAWWSVCHGYNHPHIVKAIKEQAEKLPHVMFAGLAHEPAYTLAKKLVDILPKGLEKIFFADSGSVAVEVAMKMATQYWHNNGDNKKNKFISFKGCYHGDTMGAMSLADPEKGMHKVFNGYMPMQYVVDIPSDEYSFSEFRDILKGIKKTVAGIIVEPLFQGAGAMRFYSPDILAELYKIAKENDILFIADEIATGFGRTGLMFASSEAGISPDIMCLGKALTGGHISLAAVATNGKVFNSFLGDSFDKVLMHGPTFMANPIACAAAIASLELFEKEERLKQVEKIEAILSKELSKCSGLEKVKTVRVKGAVGVVELKEINHEFIVNLRQKFIERGVWLRPFQNYVYIMPPFVISEDELTKITNAVFEILKA